MEKKPIVSVIMSEYNTNLDLLHKSISSIVDQTYKNWELIIIDDASKNDVAKLVKEYDDDRIKVYRNKKNMGLVHSLNEAIKHSSGIYIARMDTDDYSYSDRLEKQVKFFEQNNKYDVISGRCDYYDENDGIWGVSKFYGEVTKDVFLGSSVIIHPSVMCKKEVFSITNGYLDYRRCEDSATWIELFLHGKKFYVMDEVLIKYHLSADDIKKRSLLNRRDSFRLIREKYKKLNPSSIKIATRYIKVFTSAVMPHRIMFAYHKRKGKKALKTVFDGTRRRLE